jgi:hypothetical protein
MHHDSKHGKPNVNGEQVVVSPNMHRVPDSLKSSLDAGLPGLSSWFICSSESRESICNRLSKFENTKDLVPFALHEFDRDVACFSLSEPGRIVVVSDFADPTTEQFRSPQEWYERSVYPDLTDRVRDNIWGVTLNTLAGFKPLDVEIPGVVELEKTLIKIVQSDVYRENIMWGEPRAGHPEGAIKDHIEEIRLSIGVIRDLVSDEQLVKLLILAHTHDSFKKDAKVGVSISDPNSHASLAANFLTTFGVDGDLVAMVQNHDVPVALWRAFTAKGSFNEGRLENLLTSIKDWDLFLKFIVVDGLTGNKDHAAVDWIVSVLDKNNIQTAEATKVLSRLLAWKELSGQQ